MRLLLEMLGILYHMLGGDFNLSGRNMVEPIFSTIFSGIAIAPEDGAFSPWWSRIKLPCGDGNLVNIAPIRMVMTWGWCKWHRFFQVYHMIPGSSSISAACNSWFHPKRFQSVCICLQYFTIVATWLLSHCHQFTQVHHFLMPHVLHSDT